MVKFLRELFSTLSLNISKKIVFSVQINLVFVHLTHVKTNYYQLFIILHEGLLFKLEHIGISGNLLSLLKSFLSNRFQRVVLNGQCSSWSSVLAGVPQGSILGPLLFLIYINDLPENLQSTVKLFADDTSLFSIVYDSDTSASQLKSDLKKISHWAYKW